MGYLGSDVDFVYSIGDIKVSVGSWSYFYDFRNAQNKLLIL